MQFQLSAAPNLKDYRLASTIWVSTEETTIQYESSETYTLSAQTYVQIHINDLEWVPEGTHIATVNPDKLRQEQEAHQLELSQHEIRREEFHEELEEQWLKFEKDKSALELDIIKLEILAKEITNKANREKIALAIEKLNHSLTRLEKKMAEEKKQQKISIFDSEQRLQLEKSKSALVILELKSRITAPFDCQIRYINDKLAFQESVWLDQSDLFSMVDTRNIVLSCHPQSFSVTKLPAEKVHLILPTAQGQIKAIFHKKENSRRGTQLSSAWKFKIENDEKSNYEDIIGTSQLGNLFFELDSPAYIVPKTDLATMKPQALAQRGWNGVTKALWPDSKLLYSSPRFLAIYSEY